MMATMETVWPPMFAWNRVGDAPISVSEPASPGICQLSVLTSVMGSSRTIENEPPEPFPVVTNTPTCVAATLLHTLAPTSPAGTAYHVAGAAPDAWATEVTPPRVSG